MMHKKKPRIRNRPRNKCNRNEGTTSTTTITEDNQNQHVEDLPASPSGLPNADTAAGTADVGMQETIKLIQELLRKKLLAKKKDSSTAAAAAVPLTEQVKSTPVEVPVVTVKKESGGGGADGEMNEFLKCIGSKLTNASNVDKTTASLFNNLEKLFTQEPVSDIESSDDEGEYVEYVYSPRQYFMVSLCNLCKADLLGESMSVLPCTKCGLSYYCSAAHMNEDQEHRQLCYGLRQLVANNGRDIFYKCGDFSIEQFRSYRIVCIRQVEKNINRSLTAMEQEVLLFPRICNEVRCREHKFKKLATCTRCGEVAFCKDHPNHLSPVHDQWCSSYQIFKAFIMFQAKFGRLEPSLPTKVLRELPMVSCNTRQMMKKLNFNVADACEHAALTQLSTGPLTAWYALKICQRLRDCEQLTVHLIGAEIEFEVDMLQKWELFFLHITPAVKTLNVVFVGPELNPHNISFDQLKKIKCCRICRKLQRTVEYHFENKLYHDYCTSSNFLNPDLVCFFNSGLYRGTGFGQEDTWPDTIRAALKSNCPIVVTSYTKYEAPLDMTRFINESNRHINVALPPTTNPFASEKPERNFISDEEAPFIFKNFYCFVVD